ncbi:MAG: asparagine synthetase B, partial [Planctomycetota bacterium]
MCGIAAIIGAGHRETELESMVANLRRRGPDRQRTEWMSGYHAGLGHTRLRIIDLTAAGDQPMSDPSGRYRIIFNGEVYNHDLLRSELEGRFAFSSRTDTEVVLAAWLQWGRACLDRFFGMVAFAIWDDRERVLHAARDRFGVKP